MVWHICFFSVAEMSTMAVISVLIWVHTYMTTVTGNKMITKQHIINFHGSFKIHVKLFCRNKYDHDWNCSLEQWQSITVKLIGVTNQQAEMINST